MRWEMDDVMTEIGAAGDEAVAAIGTVGDESTAEESLFERRRTRPLADRLVLGALFERWWLWLDILVVAAGV